MNYYNKSLQNKLINSLLLTHKFSKSLLRNLNNLN